MLGHGSGTWFVQHCTRRMAGANPLHLSQGRLCNVLKPRCFGVLHAEAKMLCCVTFGIQHVVLDARTRSCQCTQSGCHLEQCMLVDQGLQAPTCTTTGMFTRMHWTVGIPCAVVCKHQQLAMRVCSSMHFNMNLRSTEVELIHFLLECRSRNHLVLPSPFLSPRSLGRGNSQDCKHKEGDTT